MSDKKCEDLIEGELADRIAELKAVFKREEIYRDYHLDERWDWQEQVIEKRRNGELDKDEAREVWQLLAQADRDWEGGIESYLEGILSADKLYTVYRVQLSWGGPSDEFWVYVNEHEVDKIEYYYKDWYDGARRELEGEAFEVVKQMVGYLFLEGVE